MVSRDEATLPATRRPKSRKSIASIPQTDQENMTADLGALSGKRPALGEKPKKLRSKSIGPGGLDALTDSTGNRRKSLSLVSNPPPKSILKPTMPPLKEIPAHISARSPKKSTPPTSILPTPPAPNQNLLIDFSLDPPPGPTVTGGESLPNPFQIEGSAAVNETRVTLRTEEEQQAAAREREEKERKELEKEVNSRRDARRKSLANRRVSFAPEATLHTWDVVVEYQDSTTSSAATNSTRRASSAAGTEPGTPQSQTPDFPSSDPSEPPSTPPEQVEEDTVAASPAHQRDLHQKKRRRSSGIPPMNFNNPDEALSSSPYSGDSDEDGDVQEDVEDDGCESNSDNDDDDDDGTAMSLDGNTTDMSMASVKSASSTGSSARLEEALQAAARQAGTQGIDFDEHGDTPMSEDEEVVASFAPWSKKTAVTNLESRQDQENLNPFSPAFKAVVPEKEDNNSEGEEMTMDMTMDMTCAVGGIIPPQQQQDDEMSMDVTRAFGGIITNGVPNKPETSRKSMPSTRRRSTRRRSSGSSSSLGDETMDMTMAMGGIMPPQAQEEDQSNNDEDMTMEFTSVIGGALPQGNGLSNKNRKRSSMAAAQKKRSRESLESTAGDETMDMTMAMGGIMPSISESAPDELDTTMGMEMTTALGGILQPQLSTGNRSHAKKIMELETDFGSSPFRVDPVSPPKSAAPQLTVAMASETGSPSLAAFRGKSLRRSADARKSTTPKSKLSEGTPVKKPTTPSKQLTPRPERPTTPSKTPPSKIVVLRTSSPKRLFKDDIKTASTTPQSALPKKLATPNRLFQKDMTTGVATPNVVLTPQRRVSSGIGFDREGLGSPRVAALLDRRQSIGDQARPFVPSGLEDSARGVRFQSPRAMEEEVDKERQQEEDRENGRKILEREADQGQDDKDSTLNLKEMIQSMTPKKKPLKGRKSLHVGAAKGILGKRPAELDEEEEEEEEDDGGVKRLKGHQGSPVKNIRLPAPPSKAETTTGRLTRAARKSLEDVSTTINTPTTSSSPIKDGKVTTPHGQGRFKDAEANASPEKIGPFAEKEPVDEPEIDEESFGDERIQLQDFLNMTSIRFMELTTTKRRHTIAPKRNSLMGDIHGKPSAEDAVATGASTIPMLELFQHQCRELKTYISEGRRTIREIENTTFEENPPLFREYISAPHDVKLGMDNQLKNVKTHARLLSKGTWYEWRMKLLRTLLDDGLFKIADGMVKDEELLDHQQAILNSVLPKLVEANSRLTAEEASLLSAAEELANCDPAELADARDQLIAVDADIEAKERRIADLRRQLQGTEVEIEAGISRKQTCLDDIREAERVREECRGWNSNEIVALKAKVDKIEQEYGWKITGVSGTTTSMTYRKEIELVFDAASFRSTDGVATGPVNSRIDLWYIAANREPKPLPLTAEKDFFLQNIRDHIRGLPQSETPVKDLLHAVSVAWNKANAVVDDIHLLNLSCPTVLTKTSDNSIRVKSNLMLVPLATKVEITFELVSHSVNGGIDVEICPSATVVYGEKFNEPKMREFLLNRLGNWVQEKGVEVRESWGGAVAELAEKLLARGRK